MWHIWLIFAGIFMIAEICTNGFLIFWLGLAALVSMIVSFFVDSIFIQTCVFLLSSCLFLLSSKYFFAKIMKFDKGLDVDPFSIVGKKALVTTTIDNIKNVGLIKVGGESWSASSSDNSIIQEGSNVTITKVEGVKAIVTVES